MFEYETIKWKFRINKRLMSILLTAVYFGGLIPLLVLGYYDWPSADDFSMALQTRQYFVQSGNILGTIWTSLIKSHYVYTHYEGYFFSIILTCICPSVFGESWYMLTPFLVISMLTFGVVYFFDALFIKAWRLDKDITNSFCMLTLIMMIQFMPGDNSRVEAFFWYSGAINYTFTFGMAFFWIGLLFRIIYDKNGTAKKRKIAWACIWGFMLGGANYLSALELAICSVLIMFILLMIKTGHFKIDSRADKLKSYYILWLPSALNIIGFACSCLSPGNSYRSEETLHYGALKSIMLSLYSTFDLMINNMMRWETIICLLIIATLSWKMAEGLEYKLKHPLMFVVFSFLFVSSNVTPPFYGTADISAGRLKALAWMEFVFMAGLTIFYITVWLRQSLYMGDGKLSTDSDENDRVFFSPNTSMLISILVGFLMAGSVLCVIPEPHYYSVTSSIYDIVTGNAHTYRQENKKRLELLQDKRLRAVELDEHICKPEMLFYADVTPNPEEWINQATATYYGKDAVYIKTVQK